jgi:hypothetical protein
MDIVILIVVFSPINLLNLQNISAKSNSEFANFHEHIHYAYLRV